MAQKRISTETTYEILAAKPIDSRFTTDTNINRDLLPASYRYEGLLVYVSNPFGNITDSGVLYQLVDGIENSNWSEVGSGGGTGGLDLYPYNTAVTNPIGDLTVGTTHENRQVVDMIQDMISPYQQPTVTSVINNANSGSFAANQNIEIGITISSFVTMKAVVSNAESLNAITPLEVFTGDIFLEDGNYTYPLPGDELVLTPTVPLNPISPIVYSIQVRVKDINDTISAYKNSTITYSPRIFWGSIPDADILLTLPDTEIAIGDIGLTAGGNILSSSYKRTYELSFGGYGYVLIPAMLNPVSISWTEVSDPNAPAGIGMVDLGSININNGIGIYEYIKWRTPFSNINGVKLKAS